MAIDSMTPNSARRRLVVPAVIATGVLLALAGAYYLTYEPAPVVRVRWREGLPAARRAELERRFLLVRPVPHEGRTLSYDLLDTRHSNVAELLGHPDAEDTDYIDRSTATLPFDGPYGESWMWIAHRTPVLRRLFVYRWRVTP